MVCPFQPSSTTQPDPAQINAPVSQHPTHPSILRYFLQIQSLPPVQSAQSSLPNSFPPISINLDALPIPPRQVVVPPVKAKKEKKAVQPEGHEASVVAGASAVAAALTDTAASAAATAGSAVQAVTGAVVEIPSPETTGGANKEADGKKKEKKEKPAKAALAKEEPTGPMPSMIDMRVGRVMEGECWVTSVRSLRDW